MTRLASFSTVLVAVLLALAPVGCGGDDSGDSRSAGTTPAEIDRARLEQGKERLSEREIDKRLGQVDEEIADAAERGDDAAIERAERRERDLEKQLEARDDADEEFKESPFDRLVGRLPIKTAPLRVQQTIQFGNSHRLWVAVAERHFLCSLSVAEREQAVADFYAESQELARPAGVDDLTLVVTRLQETGENMPRWATAGPAGVQITQAGRRTTC